jgi:hypothetical protein
MRLLVERVSTRRTGNEYGVFDEATGKCVGTVRFDKVPRVGHKSYPTRTIRLFDSKYARQCCLRCKISLRKSSSSMTAAASGGV